MRELGHALAIDGAPALLQRAFDAAILGHALDALGVDLLGLGVELALVLGVFGGKRRVARPSAATAPRSAISSCSASPAWPLCAVAMRSCCSVDGAAALLHLLHEILLDLALRALRGLGQARQLLVVGLPAVGVEQPFGLLDLPLLRQRADVGDHAADLVGACGSRRRACAASAGKMALKCESKEKNTEAAMEARNITHSTAFLTIRRRLCT